MADDLKIKVNGKTWPVAASPDTPLLYVLSNELRLQGPRFGCGLAQCGSCSVLADGVEIRSCVTPVASVANKSVTTLEGLPALYAEQTGAGAGAGAASVAASHDRRAVPAMRLLLQRDDHQGLRAARRRIPRPTEQQIRAHMDGHLCRCGTYPRVMKSIQLASTRMAGAAK